MIIAAPGLLNAQAPGSESSRGAWSADAPDATLPVVMTISGAISLGSYQSGVNWALVDFFRYAHRHSAYRQDKHLPDFHFAAMAGASAGNINAVLSAIEWCNGSDSSPANESLFWKAWITTGWQELFPAARKQHLGSIFDRTHFDGPLKQALAARLSQKALNADCDVPIGISVTRLEPISLPLIANISASTQRFASVIRLTAESDHLQFSVPPAAYFDRSLGVVVSLLPRPDDAIPIDTVMKLVEASSAFPLAFAPVQLTYYDIAGPKPVKPQTANFVDGGVFDNNPLDLALELNRVSNEGGAVQTSAANVPRVIYINPDALRDPLAAIRTASDSGKQPRNPEGIDGVLQLLGGVVPSARQYEMQSLIRDVARGDEANIANWITTTDRAEPVFSEHHYAFAGFFARPWREFDFYAGAYDGMHYLAREVLCAPSRLRGRLLDECTRAEFDELETSWRTALGDGDVVVKALRDWERASASTYNVSQQGGTSDDLKANVVYPTLFRAAIHSLIDESLRADFARRQRAVDVARDKVDAAKEEKSKPDEKSADVELAAAKKKLGDDPCRGDAIDRTLCRDGFASIVASLHDEKTFRGVIAAWAKDPACTRSANEPRDECLADSTMMSLLDDQRAFTTNTLNAVFNELHNGAPKLPQSGVVYDLTELALATSEDDRRPFILFDQSTIPNYAGRFVFLARLLPYYAGSTLGAAEGAEIGWLPSLHIGEPLRVQSVYLRFPIGINYSRAALVTDTRWHVTGSVGAGLAWRVGKAWLHDVEFDERATRPFDSIVGAASGGGPMLSWRATFSELGGRFRVGYGSQPSILTGPIGGGGHVYTIGIGDTNGLVYWITRLINH